MVTRDASYPCFLEVFGSRDCSLAQLCFCFFLPFRFLLVVPFLGFLCRGALALQGAKHAWHMKQKRLKAGLFILQGAKDGT